MSPYKKIRIRNKMTLDELAERMLMKKSLVRKMEQPNIVPSLHYHANFKAIFNVTDEELKGEKE